MNCPLCAYESSYAAMRCPSCRTVFDSEALETLWHLVYLRDRLERWRSDGVLGPEAAEAALAAAEREIAAVQAALVPTAPTVATSIGVTTQPLDPTTGPDTTDASGRARDVAAPNGVSSVGPAAMDGVRVAEPAEPWPTLAPTPRQ